MGDISKVDMINTIRSDSIDNKFGSIPKYIYLLKIFDEHLNQLVQITNSGNFKGRGKILKNIISTFKQHFLNEMLIKYLDGSKIEDPFTTKSTTVRYVHYHIIEALLKKGSFTYRDLMPFRINKQFSTLVECLCFYTILLDNKCTNIDIDDSTIQSKLQSLPGQTSTAIIQFISTEFKVGILIINHNKRPSPLYATPTITTHYTPINNKCIVILSHKYYGVDNKYEAIIFNSPNSKQIKCTLNKIRKAKTNPKSITPPPTKPPSTKPPSIHKAPVTSDATHISVDPLDNGEELPIIECEINGEKERYLLGKTNILYSLDTPSKLIGKLNITDEASNIGNLSQCNS